MITSMITDRIITKFEFFKALFLNQTQEIPRPFFASSEKKNHLSSQVLARTVQLLRHDAYRPIELS